MKKNILLWIGASVVATSVFAAEEPVKTNGFDPALLEQLSQMAPGFKTPAAGDYIHVPPTMEDLEASDLHPELKAVIRRGHDLFVDTQQLRGVNVFNNMNCSSCHMGEGRLPNAGPVWPAVVTLPEYRGKNGHVNNWEERIVGCFAYSMNGIPPEYGSDNMLALTAYHQWLARGVPMYPASDQKLYGRGYARLADPELKPDVERGRELYQAQCAMCHAEDGSGTMKGEKVVFPALWGDGSYNWGAGIARPFTLAAFVKQNMPLGKPNSLTEQQAWDLAEYIDTRERPQDPRYTGDVRETREMYLDTFHKNTRYGTELNGELLGDHANTGHKPIMKPELLRSRSFE